jgi:predicted SAM-dependent methyltransferase
MNTIDRFIRPNGDGKTMLNLGCGKTFHKDWVNVDFKSSSPEVISCDLTEGIPFSAETFDVVYHSHVLEHFTSSQADFFIKECFRVLKRGGILRIAVPDLEMIVRNYLQFLEQGMLDQQGAKEKYEWTMLELFDQMTRDMPGGRYKDYLLSAGEDQKKFSESRLGKELEAIQKIEHVTLLERLSRKSIRELFQIARITFIKSLLFLIGDKRMRSAFDIGLFRLSGEIHQCMYDQYSLSKLLKENNFEEIKKVNAFQSDIAGFASYNLDVSGEMVRKPDSLFIEGRKK